jgi:chemotaxis protein MotB
MTAGSDEDDERPEEHADEQPHRHANTFHEDHEEGEPWLLSYADMVTLLMCFFILFFSLDKSKGGIASPERLRKQLQRALALDPATVTSQAPPDPARAKQLEEAKKALESQLFQVSKELKVVFALSQPDPETLSLTFLSNSFFLPGNAELTPEARKTLAKVASRIKHIANSGLKVEIDGHTDSDPVTNQRFPSNWELSTARAAGVARALIAGGVPASAIQVSGFADQRPVVVEHDANGITLATAKRLNRRVEINLKVAGESRAATANAARGVGSGAATSKDAPPKGAPTKGGATPDAPTPKGAPKAAAPASEDVFEAPPATSAPTGPAVVPAPIEESAP